MPVLNVYYVMRSNDRPFFTKRQTAIEALAHYCKIKRCEALQLGTSRDGILYAKDAAGKCLSIYKLDTSLYKRVTVAETDGQAKFKVRAGTRY